MGTAQPVDLAVAACGTIANIVIDYDTGIRWAAPAEAPRHEGERPARLSFPVMATLTRADVAHVAHLARLGLTDEELARLEGQLNGILDQYAILQELDTASIPPTAQTIELENILRPDVAEPSMPIEAVLANAPETEGTFIVVPAILGGDAAE